MNVIVASWKWKSALVSLFHMWRWSHIQRNIKSSTDMGLFNYFI